jgi:hypothetical protein
MFRFLGLSLGPWWLAISLILMVADARSGRSVRNDWYYVCLIGALTSSMWFLAMISHGFIHRHFLYRHLFFAFFLAVLFGAVKVSRYAMDRYKSQHWAWPDRLDPAKPNVPAV